MEENIDVAKSIAFSPDSLIIAMAPTPAGVAKATIVSL